MEFIVILLRVKLRIQFRANLGTYPLNGEFQMKNFELISFYEEVLSLQFKLGAFSAKSNTCIIHEVKGESRGAREDRI